MTRFLLFDWGNTIMVDFKLPGPMYTWNKVAWVPGAEDALKALSQHTLCIATNAGESNTEAVKKGLARVGADTYFKFVFSSWDIGYEKPDARFFQVVLENLQTLPGNCIMIGDNYSKDIGGAKSAGMKTILFNSAGHENKYSLADAVIRSMSELPNIIKKL
jgi:putative hydrolase of the HAD superfamily